MSATELAELRGVPGKVRGILVDYARAKREIVESPQVRLDATDSEIRQARERVAYDLSILKKQAAQSVATLAAETEERAARVTLSLKQSLRPAALSGDAELARQIAEDRAWRRIGPLLEREANRPPETGTHPSIAAIDNLANVQARLFDFMADALAGGDEATVQALIAESSAFVRFHFDAERAAGTRTDLMNQLSAARPEIRATLESLQEVEAGTAAVRAALGVADRGIDSDRSLVSVPGWPGEEAEQVMLASDGDEISVSVWGGMSRVLHHPQ